MRDDLSDNEFNDNQQNNTLCLNQHDNVSSDDFSDLMHLNSSPIEPVQNLSVESIENGEIKLNIIQNSNDKQDKNYQDMNDNTQFKLLPSNLNTSLPQQIYLVTKNGVSADITSPLLLIKKSDQNTMNTTQQLNDELHHQTDQLLTSSIKTQQQPNRTTNELLINSFKNNTLAINKNKKLRKEDSDEDLDANDYFGRMIASLLKEFDQEERKSIRLAVLQLITDWSKKKHHNENK